MQLKKGFSEKTIAGGDSSRSVDYDGNVTIKGNPLTKAGVFPYPGWQIDQKKTLGLDPNKTYLVFRAPEELKNIITQKSFAYKPVIEDHTMVTRETVDDVSKDGVITERVFFEDGYLKADLVLYSQRLLDQIDSGKKDLSIGYYCDYHMQSGTYQGKHYDAVQKNIRGNHVAVVDEGIVGPDVSVLDKNVKTHANDQFICFDKMEFTKMDKATSPAIDSATLDALKAQQVELFKQFNDTVDKKFNAIDERLKVIEDKKAKDDDDMDDEVEDEDVVANEKDKDTKDKEAKDDDADKDKKSMDSKTLHNTSNLQKIVSDQAKQIKVLNDNMTKVQDNAFKFVMSEVAQRDELVNKLSTVIGPFDYRTKTLKEVAKYGVDKLKIACDSGQEFAVLNGYFAAYSVDKYEANTSVTVDGAEQSTTSHATAFLDSID